MAVRENFRTQVLDTYYPDDLYASRVHAMLVPFVLHVAHRYDDIPDTLKQHAVGECAEKLRAGAAVCIADVPPKVLEKIELFLIACMAIHDTRESKPLADLLKRFDITKDDTHGHSIVCVPKRGKSIAAIAPILTLVSMCIDVDNEPVIGVGYFAPIRSVPQVDLLWSDSDSE